MIAETLRIVIVFSADIIEIMWAQRVLKVNKGHVYEWKKVETENYSII